MSLPAFDLRVYFDQSARPSNQQAPIVVLSLQRTVSCPASAEQCSERVLSRSIVVVVIWTFVWSHPHLDAASFSATTVFGNERVFPSLFVPLVEPEVLES